MARHSARRENVLCDLLTRRTQPPAIFQLNLRARSLGEFPRRFLGQYRKDTGTRSLLKIRPGSRGDWQAIPVTQHERVDRALFVNVLL